MTLNDRSLTGLLVDTADLQTGEIGKRVVSAVWLRSELEAAVRRLESGLATNLDLFLADANPQGCFHHQDAQELFHRLVNVPNCTSLAEKISLVKNAAAKVAAD